MPKQKERYIKTSTIRLTQEDLAAISRIRAAYPCHLTSDNKAIQWALQELDRQVQQQLQNSQTQH